MLKTFKIKKDSEGISIELESNEPKFKSLEKLMYRIATHYLEKDKINELKRINRIIEAKINTKEVV